MGFKEFNLESRVIEGIEAMGYDKPTPIQEQAIPLILEDRDLIACAQTGTGKTAAFLLPVIHNILANQDDSHNIKALIITPTRELAVQIDQQLEGMAYFTGVSSLAVYGGGDGTSFDQEKKALTKGADIIVGTPGRLIAHLNMGYVAVGNLKHLILDEADRMLDMGFHLDINKIISYIPEKRQTLMFSATMPPKIRQLAKKILKDPEEISIAISKPAEGVLQAAFMTYDAQKVPLVKHLLSAKKVNSVLIFSSTKDNVKRLNRELQKLKFNCEAIHSDLEQQEREHLLRRFKNRDIQIVVATDVMSRGIDIDGIGLVMNYDVPSDGEDYIHRIGRTARASSTGVAFTLVNEDDMYKLNGIEKLLEKEIPKAKLPAELGEGPVYNPKAVKRNNYKSKNYSKRR